MAVVHPALLSLMLMALTLTSYHRYSSREQATSSVSGERGDRNLTVYAMAVGQGDGNVVLCPNGRDIVIVDMGSSQLYAYKSYGGYLLKKFGALNNMNIHIVITHPDVDHYSFLPDSFRKDDWLIKSIKEIVLGGSYVDYEEKFRTWLRDISRYIPVYTVNNGVECFNNSACSWTPVSTSAIKKTKKFTSDDRWQFCGDNVHITVLGANICGMTCKNNNARSIILKLVYKEWSLFMSGDFEGICQQKKLIDHWPQPLLQSTYYKVAHHGAWTPTGPKPNMPELLQAIRPRRAYVSSAHPLVSRYSHPRCEVFDYLINLGSVNKTNTLNDANCCEKKLRSRCYVQGHKLGYAIYETCRYYDQCSDCQVCQDIEITTDGYNDYTVYRNVPGKYVYPSSKNCQKPHSDNFSQTHTQNQL